MSQDISSTKPVDYSKNAMPSSDSPYSTPPGAQKDSISVEGLRKPTDRPQNTSEPIADIAMASVIIESKKTSTTFKKFVIAGLLIILIIYAGVGYLYYKNENLKNLLNSLPQGLSKPSPTPSFDPTNIIIQNGNIVYKTPDEALIVINKSDYPTTGITGFSRVLVSPDNKMLCFEALAPAPKPGLYISDVDGNNTKLISANKYSCLWTKDSKSIIYQGKAAGSNINNIFIYEASSATERNLTENVLIGEKPDFTIVGLSSDESAIICSYLSATDQTIQCQIDLQSGEFTSL